MNYLQLCQAVQRLQRSAAGQLGTTPTTTLNQEGDLLEIVENVSQAYKDIQNKHDNWRFMNVAGTFNTASGTRTYTPTSSIATFEKLTPYTASNGSPYILGYTSSLGVADQNPIYYRPWEHFAGGHFDRGTAVSSRPFRFTVQPNGDWEFDPTPDNTYVLNFHYRRTEHDISGSNTNEPLIPARNQMVIVWGALRYFCLANRDASRFQEKVEREYLREMRRLEIRELPDAGESEATYP